MIAEAEITTVADVIPILVSAVLVYGWFMISSKMAANWWIPLVILIATIYTINLYREHSKTLTRDVHTYMEYTEYAAIALSILVTMAGFFIYVGEKKLEYRGKFDYSTFILGTETCKNTPTKTAYWDSLKAAFFVAPGSGFGSSTGSGQRGGFVGGEDSIAPVSSFDFKASVLE
jgi:uncharacterized membrane protein YgcG